MKVKQLKIKAFRGIQDLTLEFDQNQPTVLIGVNGVGKSSILDCLATLLSCFAGGMHNSVSISSLGDQDITEGKKETNIEITVLLDQERIQWSLTRAKEKSKEDIAEITKVIVEHLRVMIPGFTGINSPEEAKIIDAMAVLGNIKTKAPPEAQRIANRFIHKLETGVDARLPITVYYPVNRAVSNITLSIEENDSFEPTDAYSQALTERPNFNSFFGWFKKREDLENELRVNNHDYQDIQLEAVRQAIHSLLPEFNNLKVRRSPLRMTVTKQGKELIINQLSDGEKCLLAMVGDLARRLAIANPGLDNPLEGEGVVLIDEIELHLHPKWQRAIVPALTRTFPNSQFIVTTHSPQVLSEVQPNSIYILESTDRGIIAKRPTSSYGRDSNQILEDLMDVSERPVIFKEQLLEIFRLIDAGDLEGAKQLRQQIAEAIGADEPELVKASTSIRRREILNK